MTTPAAPLPRKLTDAQLHALRYIVDTGHAISLWPGEAARIYGHAVSRRSLDYLARAGVVTIENYGGILKVEINWSRVGNDEFEAWGV